MAYQIPPDAKELISRFEEEEAKKATERATGRTVNPSPEKPLRLRNVTASDVEAHAMALGCWIETGGGKHGKHIVGPDGREISLPDHGRGVTLATGTAKTIENWLNHYKK